MKITRFLLALTLILGLAAVAGCSDDDDNGGTNPNPNPTDPWVGTWLSEGANIAPILVGFNIERVLVTFNEDGTVELTQTITGTAPTTQTGVYTVTESASGDIHSISIVYSAFEQEGIIQVIESADPDEMKLEVVQTVPDISATPPTPAGGFGVDPDLGATNVQTYVRQ